MSPPPASDIPDLSELEQAPRSVLVGIIVRQQELIEQLAREVERLKGIIDSDSQSSSKPPSSDLVRRSEKPKPAEEGKENLPKAGKRKAGGQPGHQGKTRKGFGRVDRYEVVHLEHCPRCGSGHIESVGQSYRCYQVAQLVAKPIEVVEYQQWRGYCGGCGSHVAAPLPEDVVAGEDLGVSLQAMLVWLSHYGHLSYGKQQEWLKELGDIEVGVGTLVATTRRASQAVAAAVDDLQAWAKQQPQLHVDETAWLVKGVKEWLWTISGEGFALLHAGDTRSRSELEQLLGKSFAGVLISDDYSVYNGYPVAAQQKCLAHLLRHFKQVAKLKPPHQKALAEAFIALIKEAFDRHRHYRLAGDRASYDLWAEQFKVTLAEAIAEWRPKAGHAAGLLLTSLVSKAHQWWYFLDHPQVPPDNNCAERSLRLGVTKRKVSGGSRSMSGFEHTARLLSVIQTCRAQGRSAIAFVGQALAKAAGAIDLEVSLIPLQHLQPCAVNL
ncbi:MAG: IS66 family transposase [Elainellaceae cyanobacterium]